MWATPPTPAGADAGNGSFRNRLELSDLEDFGPAIGTYALDRRATVFHGHLFGFFDLDLLTLFDAVALSH